jgi:hypothetical protein
MLQARQTQETAGSLDRVDQPEDVTQQFGIVGILLKPDQLSVKQAQAFDCLGQKFL